MLFVQISIKKVEKMRKRKIFAFALAVSVLTLSFTGCGYPEEDGTLSGKWAYIHETDETAFKVNASEHKAVLDGVKYSCDVDPEYITLTDKDGNTMKLRYVSDNKGIYLYKIQEYTYEGIPEEGSLTGVWANPEKTWSFEFTATGEFKEDGIFPGIFYEDKEAGTIKLMYNDHFEDTVMYYSIVGNKLTVEYPWRMVRPE